MKNTLLLVKRWGTARNFYTALFLTDHGNNIIASLLLQHYGLMLWLFPSIQWIVGAFASIICSYSDWIDGRPLCKVRAGIDQRITSPKDPPSITHLRNILQRWIHIKFKGKLKDVAIRSAMLLIGPINNPQYQSLVKTLIAHL